MVINGAFHVVSDPDFHHILISKTSNGQIYSIQDQTIDTEAIPGSFPFEGDEISGSITWYAWRNE